jgi:hypothetical protein
MLKFTNIKLADGKSGADRGQGLKRAEGHYVTGSDYSIGTTANNVVNDDYYIVWNEWPTFTGSATHANHTSNVAGTDLALIGITSLSVRSEATHSTGSLDCVIVRKSDRKAVRITVTGSAGVNYKANINTATIAVVDPKDGPWTPELGRLLNQGQI